MTYGRDTRRRATTTHETDVDDDRRPSATSGVRSTAHNVVQRRLWRLTHGVDARTWWTSRIAMAVVAPRRPLSGARRCLATACCAAAGPIRAHQGRVEHSVEAGTRCGPVLGVLDGDHADGGRLHGQAPAQIRSSPNSARRGSKLGRYCPKLVGRTPGLAECTSTFVGVGRTPSRISRSHFHVGRIRWGVCRNSLETGPNPQVSGRHQRVLERTGLERYCNKFAEHPIHWGAARDGRTDSDPHPVEARRPVPPIGVCRRDRGPPNITPR